MFKPGQTIQLLNPEQNAATEPLRKALFFPKNRRDAVPISVPPVSLEVFNEEDWDELLDKLFKVVRISPVLAEHLRLEDRSEIGGHTHMCWDGEADRFNDGANRVLGEDHWSMDTGGIMGNVLFYTSDEKDTLRIKDKAILEHVRKLRKKGGL